MRSLQSVEHVHMCRAKYCSPGATPQPRPNPRPRPSPTPSHNAHLNLKPCQKPNPRSNQTAGPYLLCHTYYGERTMAILTMAIRTTATPTMATGSLGSVRMSVWEALATLDGFVDLSDPDTSLPNSVHAFQATPT